jgi:glycoside/pentoside/hexuronide:cation symporter, GPH family
MRTVSAPAASAQSRIDAAKLGWVTGELGLAAYTGVSSLYLLYFATEVLQLPAVWAGVALFIPRLWNILVDPIVGMLSDRTRSRFGRRRPYLLAGALIWGLAFGVMLNLPHVGPPLTLAFLFSMTFLLNNTGLALFQVPYAAMLAELSPDSAVRTRLAAYREVAVRVAILLTLAGAPRILAAAPSQPVGFARIGWVFGGVIVLGGLIAFAATGSAPHTEVGETHREWRLQLAPIRENRPFALITVTFLFVNLGDAVFSGSLVYFVTLVLLQNAAAIGLLYPVSSVAGILAAPLWSRAANRYGRARLCRLALGMNAICCLLPLLFAQRSWLMYPFMLLYGLFNTGARLLPNAIVPDTVDLDHVRTGRQRAGIFFGLFVFVQQTGFAAGGFLLSVLLTLSGVGGSGASGSGIFGVTACFTIAAAALYGAAFLTSLRYRLAPAT